MTNRLARSRRAEPDAGGVLARAALLRLIAEGFAFPADGAALAMRRGFARLDRALSKNALPPALKAAYGRTRRAWLGAGEAEIAREYVRLFHGSGPVSLRETAYGDGRRAGGRPVELADINGFYRAFGLVPAAANPDHPDHVSAEVEFLSLLLVKEAYAAIQRRRPELRLTRDAARKFVADHLGRWTPALADRLEDEKATQSYRALGRLLALAIAAEGRRLGAKPRPAQGIAPADEMQAESFVCPLAEAPRPEA